MKVRVSYSSPQMKLDEVFTGDHADAVVSAMKKAAALHVNFALRLVINAMSPLQFAQEVVKRYNEAAAKSIPAPRSCEEFLKLGEAEGLAKVLEP